MLYTERQIEGVKKVLRINKTNYWTGNQVKKFEYIWISRFVSRFYCRPYVLLIRFAVLEK